MKIVAVICVVIVVAIGIWLYNDAKKKFDKTSKEVLSKSLKFCYLYVFTHLIYFGALVFIYYQLRDEVMNRFIFTQGAIVLLLITLPFLIEFRVFPYLDREGRFDFEIMKMAAELATILSLVVLLLANYFLSKEDYSILVLYLSAIVIYFAISKLLIDFLIRIRK